MVSVVLSLLAQLVVSVPAAAPAEAGAVPADPDRLSLVVADTVSETDPQKLCERPDCTSLFLGRYKNGVVRAGQSLPAEFAARIEMGSPFNMPYRLALIVEQREGREPLVRAVTGFNQRTGEGCFDPRETEVLKWEPSGPGITRRRNVICVSEQPASPVVR
jgi:hypothetical protein